MSRLIDVDALISEIKKDTEKAIEQDDRNGSFWLGYIAGLVIKQPTIQPEPKEGRWIKHIDPFGGEQYECSECGVLWEFNDGSPEDNEAFYCPKCGSYNGGGRK